LFPSISLQHISPVLAQTRASEMGDYFRQGSGFDSTHIAILVGVLVALVVGAWAVARFFNLRDKNGYRSARALFRELCRAHQLKFRSRLLLQSLAKAHGLQQPSLLFVEPDRFDSEQIPGRLARRRHNLEQIRDQIFGRSLSR